MLSFLVYTLSMLQKKTVGEKQKILMAMCIVFEVSFLYYHIGDDPFFIALVKLLAICCILLPFLRVSNRSSSIEFEGCFDDSYRSSAAYSYLTEMRAYDRYNKYNITGCGICLEDFSLNLKGNGNKGEEQEQQIPAQPQPQSLLQCGHLFHADCIAENEQHQWNNRDAPLVQPFGKCPICRRGYDSIREKFQFDPDYQYQMNDVHPMPMPQRWTGHGTFLNATEMDMVHL